MKRHHLFYSLSVVILAVLSSSLWLKLREEREIIEDLRAQHHAAPPSTVAPLAEVVPATAAPPSSDIGKPEACRPQEAQSAMPREVIERMEALSSQIRASITSTPELLNDPEYRQARLTLLRISEAQNNPGLVEVLDLTEAEEKKLFEIMAARQLDMVLGISKNSNEGQSLSSLAEVTQRAGVAQEQALRALLGSEKYSKLLEYQGKLRPAYIQVANFEKALISSGQPLSEAQSRTLKSALLESQVRTQPTTAIDTSRPLDVLAIAQAQKADKNRRALEAVAPHLTAQQLETLRRSFDSPPSENR